MSTSDKKTVYDLPPSAKLVYKVLEYNDQLTQQQLATESRLPARTVRFALSELDSVGVVQKEISLADARQRLYSLTTTDTARIE